MKEVLNQLDAIDVQGSLCTSTGENYRIPFWIRGIARSGEMYLAEAVLYEIDGPFWFRLPSNSTVHIYAPVPGLDWNSGWGVPIQMPSSIECDPSGACALRLEELMSAATRRYKTRP